MLKSSDDPRSWLVAHRGDQTGHVENTLDAFRLAAKSGALFAECDIQFTRDLVPVVIHDDHLKRLCDLDLHVSLLDLIDLKELCYPYFTLITLHKLLAWLSQEPQLTLFIEIKPEIRKRISDMQITDCLAGLIPETVNSQIVLISESGGIVDACRTQLNFRTGWVAEGSEQPESVPDYAFIPVDEAATVEQWHSIGVKVGLYTVNSATTAVELLGSGAELIETNHFSRMAAELQQPGDNS